MAATAGDANPTTVDLWCPSARPDMHDAVAFGVRTGADSANRIGYLSAPVPVDGTLLDLAEPVDPLQVFRFAAPCAGTGCAHYADHRCSLATRIVEQAPVVVLIAPACVVRSRCRWFAQEGTAACRRCPQVVTSESGANTDVARAARPVLAAPGGGADHPSEGPHDTSGTPAARALPDPGPEGSDNPINSPGPTDSGP